MFLKNKNNDIEDHTARAAGFERENFIKNTENTKFYAAMALIIGVVMLYVSLNIGVNLCLKNMRYTNVWVVYSPSDIWAIFDTIAFGMPGLKEAGVVKFSLIQYFGFPVAFSFLFAAILYRWALSSAKSSKPTGLRHGTARFATYNEIAKVNLLVKDLDKFFQDKTKNGIFLGRIKNSKGVYEYIIDQSENEHILCYAPSRTGKGVGLVIPSILLWKESSIILDPKGENFEKTSAYLASIGHRCVKLHLGAPYDRYNPLSELKADTLELPDEVTRTVGIITSEGKEGGGSKDKFWDNQAKAMLAVMLTYLIATFEPIRDPKTKKVIKDAVSLYDLAIFMSGIHPWDHNEKYEDEVQKTPNGDMVIPGSGMKKLWQKIGNYLYDYGKKHLVERGIAYTTKIGEYLQSEAKKFENQNDQVRQNVVSSADQFLSLYKLPIIASIVGHSDFKLTDLVDPTKPPTTLFLINPSKDELTSKTDPIIKLLLQNLFVSVLYETGLREKTKEPGLWQKLSDCDGDYTKLENQEYTQLEQLMVNHYVQLCITPENSIYEKNCNLLRLRNFKLIDHDLMKKMLALDEFKLVGNNTYCYTKRPVLCMLDEFPKLGKFELMEKLLADAAGYGAKFYLIAQSDKQIINAYGEKNAIMDGCQHKVMYRPASFETAQNLANILGKYTFVEQSTDVTNANNKVDILKEKTSSKKWNESERYLMTPDEIQNMYDQTALIISKRLKIFAEKVIYHEDPILDSKKQMGEFYVQKKSIVEDEGYLLERLERMGIDTTEYRQMNNIFESSGDEEESTQQSLVQTEQKQQVAIPIDKNHSSESSVLNLNLPKKPKSKKITAEVSDLENSGGSTRHASASATINAMKSAAAELNAMRPDEVDMDVDELPSEGTLVKNVKAQSAQNESGATAG